MTEYENSLIMDNLKLVGHIASKYRSRPYYNDIVQAGMVGLCEAAMRFDETRGNKFSTYAGSYIHGRICEYYHRYAISPIKLPRDMITKICRGDLENISMTSLDYTPNDYISLSELIADDIDIKKECLDELSYTDLLQFMQSKLKVNEYRAFLVDFHGVKQKQIGSILGISQSFVSRTLRKARIKIIEELNDRGYAV